MNRETYEEIADWLKERRVGEVECMVSDMGGIARRQDPADAEIPERGAQRHAAPARIDLRPDGHWRRCRHRER